MPSDAPVATRKFENREGPVIMEIHAPTAHEDVGFDCRFVIRWADGRVRAGKSGGVDSMQALLLAISGAWVRMLYPVIGQRDDSLRFLESGDLCLDLIVPPDPDS